MRPGASAGLTAVLAAGSLLAPEAWAHPASTLSLASYLTLEEEHDDGTRKPVEHDEVSIDHSLVILWDEVALRGALMPPEASVRAEVEDADQQTLRDLVVRFLEVQAALAEASAAGPGGPRASREASAAHDRFGDAASTALRALDAHLRALREAGRGADARRLADASMEAVQQDYGQLAGVIEEEIGRVGDQARRALEGARRYEVQMRARLASTTGGRRLHLVGYDELAEGEPTETPRFQFGLDGRAEAEVRAAEELSQVVRQALTGELGRSLERAKAAVENELRNLAQTLKKDVLEAELRKTIAAIEEQGDARFEPVARRARDLLATLESLSRPTPPFPADGQAELLLAIVRGVTSRIEATLAEIRTLDERLEAFLDEARSVAATVPGVIGAQALEAYRAALARIRDNPDVERITETLATVRRSLGLATDVAAEALGAVAEVPRDVVADLDTRLDLLRGGERHTGELIILEAELREVTGGGAVVRTRAYRRLRLRQFGLRLEPRGALLLTDPRASTIVDQSWEPAPAISYMFHWGRRHARIWNDVFDPGIGFTATLLDHNDEDDFELGLAGSASLFRSLLWIGYGRNIQAESDFFHIGINPLVVGRLWSERKLPRE